MTNSKKDELKQYLSQNNISNSFNKSSAFVVDMTTEGLCGSANDLDKNPSQIETKVAGYIDVIIDYYHTEKELIVQDDTIDYASKASKIKTTLNNTKNLIVDMLGHLAPQVLKIVSKSKVQDLFTIANVNLFDDNIISRKVTLGQLTRNNGSKKHFKINKKNITSQLSILNDYRYEDIVNDELFGSIIDKEVQASATADKVEEMAWFKYYEVIIKKDDSEKSSFHNTLASLKSDDGTVNASQIFKAIKSHVSSHQQSHGLHDPFASKDFKKADGGQPDVVGYIDGKYSFMAANSAVDNQMEGTQMTRHPLLMAMASTNTKMDNPDLTPGDKTFGQNLTMGLKSLPSSIITMNKYIRYLFSDSADSQTAKELNVEFGSPRYTSDDYIQKLRISLDSLNIYSFQKFPDPLKSTTDDELSERQIDPTKHTPTPIKKGIAYSMVASIMFVAQMINNDPELRYVRPKRSSQSQTTKSLFGDQIALSTNTPEVIENISVGATYSVLEDLIKSLAKPSPSDSLSSILTNNNNHMGAFVITKMLDASNLVKFASISVLSQVIIDLTSKNAIPINKASILIDAIHEVDGVRDYPKLYAHYKLNKKTISELKTSNQLTDTSNQLDAETDKRFIAMLNVEKLGETTFSTIYPDITDSELASFTKWKESKNKPDPAQEILTALKNIYVSGTSKGALLAEFSEKYNLFITDNPENKSEIINSLAEYVVSMDFANDMELKSVTDILNSEPLNEIFEESEKSIIIETRKTRKSNPNTSSPIVLR